MRIDPTLPIGRAERLSLGRAATMRDPARAPVDVLIENLSETGALLRTGAAPANLPVGTLVSLGVAGAGMQFARVVRSEPHTAAIAFLVPLDREAVVQARTAKTLVSVAIPQIAVERRTDPAPSAGETDAEPITRLPVTPLPTPGTTPHASLSGTPSLTYAASGQIESIPVPVEREEASPAPDARALWLPERLSTQPLVPALASWLLVGVTLVAGITALLLS
jgi:hypothetical protein